MKHFISRRQVLLGLFGGPGISAYSDRTSGLGSMLWEHSLDYLRLLDHRRRSRLSALSSPAELAQLQEQIRFKLTSANKVLLSQNPLNVQHTATLRGSGFVIEKLIYESLTQVYVTANLYRPLKTVGLLPAVLFLPDSATTGKTSKRVQLFCARLALSGFAVLTWDPISLGERRQLPKSKGGTPDLSNATEEQHILSNQCYLLGSRLMDYRVLDVVRAIDYIETRSDIDTHRIAMVGSGSGGEETLQTVPVEPRIKAAICISTVSTSYQKAVAQLPINPSNISHLSLQGDIDHPELLAAFAPRPMLIYSSTNDFIPIESARSAFREASSAYALLGVSNRMQFVEAVGRRGLDSELSRIATQWLVEQLGKESQLIAEEPGDVFGEKLLNCTTYGQIADLPGAKTVFTINYQRARKIEPLYSLPQNRHELEIYRNKVVNKIRRITQVGHFRTETGIFVPDRVYDIGVFAKGIAFVCSDRGKDDPNVRRTLIDPLLAAGYRVVALDPRGWGETEPELPKTDLPYSLDDFFAYRGVEIGRPLLGQRIKDLLSAASSRRSRLQWLVAGVGVGALVAAHAAALDQRFSRLIAIGGLISFRSLVDNPLTKYPFSAFLPGVIEEYDIRDIYSSLVPREVLVLNPQNSQGQAAQRKEVEREFNWTRRVYAGAGATGALSIETNLDLKKTRLLLKDWL